MGNKGLGRQLTRNVAVLVMAVSSFVGLEIAVPGPARASAPDTCVRGYFCWYYLTNRNYPDYPRCRIYLYTSGWRPMGCLVDNSESSYNAQYTDSSHCVVQVNPFVYLSDTYMSTRWVSLVADSQGDYHNSFNPIRASPGSLNMNNRFNDYWNACR